ncbi:hypothetical protein MIND_00280100 [Mycena indigotica]|uniref:Ctf8-domain-containing protein n=1 Tax=Mycena indigotica TaxID=2126181 RepID=A0A8H6WBI5_9AGAR|nr:uncharacterized protein MIND_00280100 [Mycena indigotica]KAF7312659.1 hypothetical protein MIND_00280100 [Mycena indigotica]
MIVPISFNSPSTSAAATSYPLPPTLARISHAEVVLVELQGALEIHSAKPSERDGKLVGRLGIDDAGKTATLRIGHHLLEGKVVQLAKPLAVLQRVLDGHKEDNMDVDGGEEQPAPSETQTTTGWDAIALIKRKIVFSKRPTPIVGRPA